MVTVICMLRSSALGFFTDCIGNIAKLLPNGVGSLAVGMGLQKLLSEFFKAQFPALTSWNSVVFLVSNMPASLLYDVILAYRVSLSTIISHVFEKNIAWLGVYV